LPRAKCSSTVWGSTFTDEGFDGLVRLLVEQEIQALEVGPGQGPGFPHQMLDVDAGCGPAKDEKQGKEQ
jgi:hypothetical protein